jgi:hypothetical protein
VTSLVGPADNSLDAWIKPWDVAATGQYTNSHSIFSFMIDA